MTEQQEVFELTQLFLEQNLLLSMYLAYSFTVGTIWKAYKRGYIDQTEVLVLFGKARATYEPEIQRLLQGQAR